MATASSKCHKYKIMMKNLPPGTMKSDVAKVIIGWNLNVTILSIDIAPTKVNTLPHKKKLNAYIALSSQLECDSIVAFYNTHFSIGGFAFQNSSSKFDMVTVTYYSGRNNSIENKVDDTENRQRLSSSSSIENNGNIHLEASSGVSRTSASKHDSGGIPYYTEGNSQEDSGVIGVLISAEDQLILEELSRKKNQIEREKHSTNKYIQLLENTFREKCPEFFVSEKEIENIQRQADSLNSKITKQKELLEKDNKELQSLKRDFENYKLLSKDSET